ncbi:MAG: class I SAM-dependent methyltransferase [Planctomycetia bacterium]|nr:class I SAM-dependent methyltransferase [Planctomycetia bacterium]
MRVLYRAARVFADEGLVGLVRRAGRKIARLGRSEKPPAGVVATAERSIEQEIESAKREYQLQSDTFRARCAGLGYAGLDDYYWYHAVDLGDGLVTPGDYDFRHQISSFGFPADMSGMRVLDVGSATGFFAFEFERRGAEVVSVELPSLAAWDILGAERGDLIRRLMAAHNATTPEEAYERHLDGPFQFCHSRLRSRVRRCYASIYDLALSQFDGKKFDIVYAGDILMHLFSPFAALDVLSRLTGGSLLLTIEVPFPGPADQPLVAFYGHLSEEDGRTWWMPSRGCAEHMLRRIGFKSVSVVGRYSGIARRAWFPYSREVIRASWV